MISYDTTDPVFRALASSTRRSILDLLKDAPKTTGTLCDAFPELDRCTVMQHLRVLEDAELVIPQRKGRERWNHLNPLPIKHIYDRWIGAYASHAVTLLDRLEGDLQPGSATSELTGDPQGDPNAQGGIDKIHINVY